MAMKRAVFLDKDGTLVENVPYNVDPARVRLAAGAAEALPLLHRAGYRVIVVSNQSGVARGFFPESDLAGVYAQLCVILGALGVPLDGFYYCPHLPYAPLSAYARLCDCRKPAAGLLLRAAREHDLDVCRSWMIGDILDDVEAGRRAGCRTILLNIGSETEWVLGPWRRPHHIAGNLADAAVLVVSADRSRSGRAGPLASTERWL